MAWTLDKQTDFFTLVLKNLGMQPTFNRLEFFLCWAAVESTRAQNNPLATTWDMTKENPEWEKFNRIGVKNYATMEIGAKATANTISTKRGYYKTILAALKADTSVHGLSAASTQLQKEFQLWGGTPGYWAMLKKIAQGTTGTKISDYLKKKATRGGGWLTALALFAFGLAVYRA